MAYATSSILGADFSNSSSTALFTLGQRVLGSDASEWVYCKVTGTCLAGKMVLVQSAGTAALCTGTAQLLAPSDVGGYLAFAQCTALQGTYAWMATRGQNMVIACSGTVAGGGLVYFGGEAGGAISATANSCTLAGIFLTTSASTAGMSYMARATISYPRIANAGAVPIY